VLLKRKEKKKTEIIERERCSIYIYVFLLLILLLLRMPSFKSVLHLKLDSLLPDPTPWVPGGGEGAN
jgi:hypothetical protein